MVIASGRSSRHVSSIAEHLIQKSKEAGFGTPSVEGLAKGEWVLLDAMDVVVHIFKPEVRERYKLEKMWSLPVPDMELVH